MYRHSFPTQITSAPTELWQLIRMQTSPDVKANMWSYCAFDFMKHHPTTPGLPGREGKCTRSRAGSTD